MAQDGPTKAQHGLKIAHQAPETCQESTKEPSQEGPRRSNSLIFRRFGTDFEFAPF